MFNPVVPVNAIVRDNALDLAAHIYAVSDLIPGRTLHVSRDYGPADWVAVIQAANYYYYSLSYYKRVVRENRWVVVAVHDLSPPYPHWWLATLDHEPDATETAGIARDKSQPDAITADTGWTPIQSAEAVADRFRNRARTADDMLADPEFVHLARRAAENGQQFTAHLLAWGKKPIVVEAVARVRAVADAERGDRLPYGALRRKLRNSVLAKYNKCGYRTDGRQIFRVTFDWREVSAITARYSSANEHLLHVRPDWLARVVKIDPSAQYNGLLILDAEPVGGTPDLRIVYRLTLVRQGDGGELTTETVEVTKALPTAEGTNCWTPVPADQGEAITRLPAAILADYLEDAGADPDSVMPLRAGDYH